MRNLALFIAAMLLLLIQSCKPKTNCETLSDLIKSKSEAGYFTEASRMADSLRSEYPGSGKLINIANSLIDINERIRLDFSMTEADFSARVDRYLGKPTDSMLTAWEGRMWIEWRMIDGEKRYFDRAAPNLVLLKDFYEEREKQDRETAADAGMIARLKHTEQVIKKTGDKTVPVVPVPMKIIYTITVPADLVPEGETIRCWLPFPKENHERQTNVKLLSTSEANYILASDSSIHRSLYMEKIAVKGSPAIFSISYLYTSSGINFDQDKMEIRPYYKEGELYKKYTAEQLPNICFTENIKRLADEITAPGDDPQTVVRKIYMWFKENIP